MISPKSIIQFWWMTKYCTEHLKRPCNATNKFWYILLHLFYLVSIVKHETVKMTRIYKAKPFYQRTANLQLCVAIWNSLAPQKLVNYHSFILFDILFYRHFFLWFLISGRYTCFWLLDKKPCTINFEYSIFITSIHTVFFSL